MARDASGRWDDLELAYNLRADDPCRAEICSYPLFQTHADIPFIETDEFEQIGESIAAVSHNYLRTHRLPQVDDFLVPVFEHLSSIGDFRGDRTINVALSANTLIHGSYFEQLRREVLPQQPLWRVCLHLTYEIRATILAFTRFHLLGPTRG